ncbi:HEPN domain-containing protein [uncultured Desulfobulbus sp.]|uniref:HEPN domain-containing protein n=1 Tax=uncultured Desulfobulbus sp. TaxID=239745 RepID=UPI0029C7FD66|nr:HEPN domain-containing protein [uncultured Desulfobulbus sp.]
MTNKTLYWIEMAEYDLETARAMLQTGRYLYVGFMCHQVIEKTLKAVVANNNKIPPYIHNLSRLAEISGIYIQLDGIQKDLLDSLEPLNIQARYPEDKERLFQMLDFKRCSELLTQTEELYQWIKATL